VGKRKDKTGHMTVRGGGFPKKIEKFLPLQRKAKGMAKISDEGQIRKISHRGRQATWKRKTSGPQVQTVSGKLRLDDAPIHSSSGGGRLMRGLKEKGEQEKAFLNYVFVGERFSRIP